MASGSLRFCTAMRMRRSSVLAIEHAVRGRRHHLDLGMWSKKAL
jgi:hypothetical protein